jgi:hypothetical protein
MSFGSEIKAQNEICFMKMTFHACAILKSFSARMTAAPALRLILVCLWSASTGLSTEPDSTLLSNAADTEWFEKKIRPVLIEQCYQCHSALSKEVKGNLLLDTRDAARKGGDSGPAVVPGDVENSLLISALRHESLQMPPGKKLPESVIADFVKWIESGAADPRTEPADDAARLNLAQADLFQQLKRWWSLQPVTSSHVPEPQDMTWSQQPIDQFVLGALEHNGLRPSPTASRQVLIRRLSYALTGLPPKPAEITAFENDSSPDAWRVLVDRLLDSPHFGERWARHWMDVVRYTDTYGYEWDMPAKGAWRYRDYLIRAFNDDIPFDQLIREQIAGDLLPVPRIDKNEQINESLAGTMFYQMGEKRHGDSAEFDGIHQEMLDNKIEAFSKAFQAQTIACARCHDHKLDSILQSEYYALGGMFMSSRWVTNTLDLPERHAAEFTQLQALKQKIREELAAQWRHQLQQLPERLLSATTHSSVPAVTPATGEAADAASKADAIWKSLFVSSAAERPLEDPARIWQKLSGTSGTQASIAERWLALQNEYQFHSQERRRLNSEQFQVVADFRKEIPTGWSVDGVGVRDRVPCGDFAVSTAGTGVIGRLFPGGLLTNSLSPRMNGALRTPWLNTFDRPYLSVEQSGGDFSAHRTVVDNAFLTERQVYLKYPAVQWVQFSTFRDMPTRRIFVEFATKTSNPNFPPRVGLGGACSDEQIADPVSWMGISRVVIHDKPGAPMDELERFQSLFEASSLNTAADNAPSASSGDGVSASAPATTAEAAQRYAGWFTAAVQRWADGAAEEGDVRLINWMLDNDQLSNQVELDSSNELSRLVTEYRALEAQLRTPQTVNGMADIDPGFNLPLLNRGEYDQPKETVPRGYLQELGCSPDGFSADELIARPDQLPGSGRLRLSELVASPDNPLTARVFVNRVWHWLFGAGIVRTTDDFGHAGDLPSHPELLDYLAARFVAENWSLKSLVRSIVLTETWRQSSQVNGEAQTRDPENRLLHHYPLRRLEAEAIRDAMLAVSGRLDPQLYGPPVDPYRQNEDPQKRLVRGPLDGDGRRSIYTKQTIMEPPRLMALFNQPAPKIPTGKRDVTSTPGQSLALLNDPFVVQQAQFWAQRLITEDQALSSTSPLKSGSSLQADSDQSDSAITGNASTTSAATGLAAGQTQTTDAGGSEDSQMERRLQRMFRAAWGRSADSSELNRWKSLVYDLAAGHQVKKSDTMHHELIWADVAHAILNTKELIYIP